MHPSQKASGLIVKIIFIGLLVTLFDPVLGETSDLPTEGNWVVTDKEVLFGSTKVWNGNITVAAGGDLEISNSVLIFNSSRYGHQGIFVEEGGKITMTGVRLTTVNASEGLMFIANGSIEIRNCRIEHIYGTTVALEWLTGFRIRSDDPVLEDSVIRDAVGFGPRFEGCENVVFKNNEVINSSTGLLFERSSGLIQGNLFYNNTDRQVVIRDCEGVRFINNTLNMTGMGGLVVARSKDVETSGNSFDGNFYVIYVANRSSVSMANEWITGDQIQLESRDDSTVTVLDSVMNLNKVGVRTNSQVYVKRTVMVRVMSGKGPVPNATVTVKDAEKLLVAEGKTDEDGIVEFVLTEASFTPALIQGEVIEKRPGPHNFKVVKGIYSASGTANITVYNRLDMELSLPWLFIIGAAVVIALVVIIIVTPPRRSGRKPKKTRKR